MPTTLSDIVTTAELAVRAPRPRVLAAENAAFVAIAAMFSEESPGLLRALTNAALDLCGADTAGVSLLEQEAADGGGVFRWVSLSGQLHSYEGRTTPADFSPCGVSLAANKPQLFSHPARYFTYFNAATPEIVEGLVIPFRNGAHPPGTIWIVSHGDTRFTSSDVEIMTVLGDFTAAALGLLDDERTARTLLDRERLSRQQADEAIRFKDDVLRAASHDLRTPLNGIMGWSDLLVAGSLSPTQARSAAGAIHANARRQSRIVDSLLAGAGASIPADEKSTIMPTEDVIKAPESEWPLASGRALRNIRVLVVDDDDDNREVIALTLQHHGADARTAGSVADALDVLTSVEVDVLVADIGMPIQDGDSLMAAVRAAEARQTSGSRLPAAALSGQAHSLDDAFVRSAGFDMHLRKPVSAEDLVASVVALAARCGHRFPDRTREQLAVPVEE